MFCSSPRSQPVPQGPLKGSNQAWNVLTSRPGGNNLAYAWDEPTLEHKLLVHVRRMLRLCLPHRESATTAMLRPQRP